MKNCPRCHRNCLDKEEVVNALSHVDDKNGDSVYICSPCGSAQGMVGLGYCTDIVEIEMERRFRKELKK